MPKKIDLTGARFGKLYVIGRDGYLNNQKAWLCKCDCGNEVRIRSFDLRNSTRSCGCLNKERTRKRTSYIINEDTAVCYTEKGEEFYVDAEDVCKVVDRPWYLSPRGYIVANIPSNKKHLTFLHRYLIGSVDDGMVVDHIDRNKMNNRKSNLRVCKVQENIWNTSTRTANTSGFTGVDWHNGRWRARITFNNRQKHIGYYETYEEAVNARYQAEKKYYGEFAPHTENDIKRAEKGGDGDA